LQEFLFASAIVIENLTLYERSTAIKAMMRISFTPFPKMTTERLILRQLKEEDADEIFALRSDERVNKYLDRPKATTIDDARAFINKINSSIESDESIYWVVTLKNSDKLIGTICLWNISLENSRAETGYELHPDFQGKGYMQEAFSKVLEYGFETMKLKTIDAFTHPDNNKSTKLLEKYNFSRNLQLEKENNSKEIIYSLTNSGELEP
jgi:ribosomal-protein-alanine N-acetyltransferase